LLTTADVVVLWFRYVGQHDNLFGLSPLFDFNREGNLPAFYSALSLLIVATLFLVIGGYARTHGDRWQRHWLWLGVIFLFLAVDEGVELHGILSQPLRDLGHLSGALYFAWVIPYGILTIIFAIAYWRFWLALPPSPRAQFAVAAGLYILGALGFELLGGIIVSEHGGLRTGLDTWQHAITYTIEELLEMSGILLSIHALLHYISDRRITVGVRIATDYAHGTVAAADSVRTKDRMKEAV
jgi:hypothetical protein